MIKKMKLKQEGYLGNGCDNPPRSREAFNFDQLKAEETEETERGEQREGYRNSF